MITALLLIHGLLAAALIGAITHQLLSVWWPPRAAPGSFFARFRAVNVASYTNAIIIMFVIETFVGGVLLYPSYRVSSRVVMEQLRLAAPVIRPTQRTGNFIRSSFHGDAAHPAVSREIC